MKRFWDKVDRGGDCWEWMACKNIHGYGQFRVDDKIRLSHRVSWEMANCEIPNGLCVCHHCDNPGCVNPDHLFLGAQKDNVNDMTQKERAPDRSGGKNPYAKLDEMDVKFIRHWLKGRHKQQDIADAFSVSQTAISDIKTGRAWGR